MLLLASPFAGQTAEWQKYKNADGNFTVLFPAQPSEGPTKDVDAVSIHSVRAQQSNAVYSVVYTTMVDAQPVDEATFQAYKHAFFEQFPKSELDPNVAAAPAVEGYIGHAYRGIFEAGETRIKLVVNLYWGKHHSFAVMVFSRGAVEPSAEIKRFVESFAVIDPAK
jgi:hypothetical protein